ncbi:MAG TPA: hypothetical protein VIA61_03310 [Methylomirabilota bacterium]|jgi:hypothetical protein
MGKVVRGLASVSLLVGSIGIVLAAAGGADAAGPGMGSGFSVPHGPSMPSQNYGGAPTPGNLGRQKNKSSSAPSSSQSGPTTFGYWDGQRFVRSPGPWSVPDNGSKAANPRLR